MATTPDYTGYEEKATPEQMRVLGVLADRLDQADKNIADLEFKLDEAKKSANELREHDLPTLMKELGIKEVKTIGGLTVELREEVRASFFAKDKARREPAFAWLKAHNHDGLIKQTVSASFGKDQAATADRFAEFVKTFDVPVNVTQARDINHQTLLAFIRERLREGQELPLPLFGAMVQSFAKVHRDK